MRQSSFEQDRVDPVLCEQQRHVAIDLDEEVHALVALLKMSVIAGQCVGAAGAAEGPA